MSREFIKQSIHRLFLKNAGILQDKVKSFISKEKNKFEFKPFNLNVKNGYAIWPGPSVIKPDGSVNIFFQIRGGSAKVFNKASTNAIVVILEAGGKGSKENTLAFGSPSFFNNTINSILSQLKKKTGRSDIKLGKWGMASWSGGYGAIHRALNKAQTNPKTNFIKKPDYVGLFDGGHFGTKGNPDPNRLEVYRKLAEDAKNGETTFVVTHSSVNPENYASSTDTANWLVNQTGLSRKPVSKWHGSGKTPSNLANSGNFYVFGLYDKEQPYAIKDPITGKIKTNIPGTSGYQHIRAIKDAPDYLPVWN
jgi:hypothetical protein